MSYFINICFICLKHSHNLTFIKSKNTNGASIEDTLKYFLVGFALNSSTPKYICAKCERNLNKSNEFKQICLRNITTYEKYAQQITTTDSSYKYLSVGIEDVFNVILETKTDDKFDIEEENVQIDDTCPDFVDVKAEILDENNFNTNIADAQNEINEDVPNIEEIIIKEEKNDTLVLDDKLKSLLHDIKGKNSESDGTYNKNDNIIEETVQISDKKHKLAHTCEVCNKSFRQSNTLKNHRLVHTGEKPFTCEICNKSFRQLTHLKGHCSSHSKEKPFTCEVCNTSFKHPRFLKIHKLVHTGEKPFTCEVCNKSFRHSETLKYHRLIHTGEKPFSCEVCNKSFRHLSHLKRHRLLHSEQKPFTCEVCNKSFRHSHTLKNHYLVHSTKNHSRVKCVINHSRNYTP